MGCVWGAAAALVLVLFELFCRLRAKGNNAISYVQ
jgi:hypothetical protein